MLYWGSIWTTARISCLQNFTPKAPWVIHGIIDHPGITHDKQYIKHNFWVVLCWSVIIYWPVWDWCRFFLLYCNSMNVHVSSGEIHKYLSFVTITEWFMIVTKHVQFKVSWYFNAEDRPLSCVSVVLIGSTVHIGWLHITWTRVTVQSGLYSATAHQCHFRKSYWLANFSI